MSTWLPETYLSLSALLPCAVAWVLVLLDLRNRSHQGRSWVWVRMLLAVSLALATAAIAVRWAAIEHPPVFGSYENSLACFWTLVAGSLCLSFVPASRYWRYTLVGVLPSAMVTLAWGQRFNRNRIDLTISERSLWLDLHVVVAWCAYFAITVALCLALYALAAALRVRRGRALWAALPPREWAEEMLAASTSWAFLGCTGILATGAWYSWLLFGELWRWDTVEVLGLVTWLAFGLALHVRLFYGWRGARLAGIATFGYVGAIVIFWVLALFPVSSYHFFELPF